jgi:hypothetical protein
VKLEEYDQSVEDGKLAFPLCKNRKHFIFRKKNKKELSLKADVDASGGAGKPNLINGSQKTQTPMMRKDQPNPKMSCRIHVQKTFLQSVSSPRAKQKKRRTSRRTSRLKGPIAYRAKFVVIGK